MDLEIASASGTINKINNFEFEHNIPTEPGSSGSPIVLFNIKKLIDIHKYGDNTNEINGGTFIGVIINEINNDLNIINNNKILNINNKINVIEKKMIKL